MVRGIGGWVGDGGGGRDSYGEHLAVSHRKRIKTEAKAKVVAAG